MVGGGQAVSAEDGLVGRLKKARIAGLRCVQGLGLWLQEIRAAVGDA